MDEWERFNESLPKKKELYSKLITGGICHAIHPYLKENNKYMKGYDENKESSYFNKYWDVNNLHGWAILQK